MVEGRVNAGWKSGEENGVWNVPERRKPGRRINREVNVSD
jgi:hypothetical protein